jgi:hypothetical protein
MVIRQLWPIVLIAYAWRSSWRPFSETLRCYIVEGYRDQIQGLTETTVCRFVPRDILSSRAGIAIKKIPDSPERAIVRWAILFMRQESLFFVRRY